VGERDHIGETSPHSAPAKIAVVIPYYQEEPGILRGAVLSAVAQEGVSELEIIVVDDGSPAPARDDLGDLALPPHVTLKLIEQPNLGPGAARNRGLDAVSPDTTYLAFLDSDDRWTRRHLHNAHAALRAGHDVYFADGSYWKSADTFCTRIGLDPNKHICIDVEHGYFRFTDDARHQAINSKNPFHMSCIVYVWAKFKRLRFHEVAFMGEDLTFWMDLAQQTNRIAFCPDVECFAGRGVHIYESSGWGTSKAIWKIYHYMKWRKWLRDNILSTELEQHDNSREIQKLRRAFVLALLHELRRMRAFTNPDVARFFLLDPQIGLYLVPVTLRAVLGKVGWRSSRSR
jgi:succinoglycan biosynthesis protein ExoW